MSHACAQCEALPVCRGHTFVSLLSVQYTKLEQLMKNCSEWVCACDEEYFEKRELDSIIKDFSTFYNKATASKRVSNMTVDSLQFHRQSVIKLAKRFPMFQVRVAVAVRIASPRFPFSNILPVLCIESHVLYRLGSSSQT